MDEATPITQKVVNGFYESLAHTAAVFRILLSRPNADTHDQRMLSFADSLKLLILTTMSLA